jgi:hypothetical protein
MLAICWTSLYDNPFGRAAYRATGGKGDQQAHPSWCGAVRLGLHRSDPGAILPESAGCLQVCIKCCVCDKPSVIYF